MLRLILLFLVCLVTLPSSTSSEIQSFRINLDQPPEIRWKEVILAKKQFIQEYAKLFLAQLQKYDLPSFFATIEERDYFQGTELSREMMGIAEYSNLNYSEIFLINYMYENFAACTSIVYENENGEVVLGHNLDYFFTAPMAKSIVLLEFYKDERLQFKAQSVAGQIGVFSGLKNDAFAVTLNQRNKNPISNPLQRLITLLDQQILPVIYNIRKSIESGDSFQNAVDLLSTAQLGSPCYFILSGTKHNEGVVITRDASGVYNLATLNSDDVNSDGWFLVQTNSDRDTPNYQKRDIRRYQAENRVRAIGKGSMDENKMINDVLALSPNKNTLTILSSVLSAQNGDFKTEMWY